MPNVSVKTKQTDCERHRSHVTLLRVWFCASVSYHRLDDAVNSRCVNDGSALRQVHRHKVPPVDRRWRVGDLPQPRLLNVLGRRHNKHLDAFIASPLRCHFDAPAWVSSHVAIGDDHGKSESPGIPRWAQHFLSHVGEGTVGEGALTQVTDSIDTL